MADWRFRAKIVAWFDIVFSLIGLILIILALVGTLVLKEHIQDFADNHPIDTGSGSSITLTPEERDQALSIVMIVIWVTLGIAILLSFLQIYAALKLKSATEEGRDPLEASRMTRLWQIVTWVFLIITILGCLAQSRYISGVVSIAIRGLFLYIVHKFKAELETEAATPRMGKI